MTKVSSNVEMTKVSSNVKFARFRFQLEASIVSNPTEELWYNETVCW